jgi:ribosomal protein S18 acetylase RimI-like enzyme
VDDHASSFPIGGSLVDTINQNIQAITTANIGTLSKDHTGWSHYSQSNEATVDFGHRNVTTTSTTREWIRIRTAKLQDIDSISSMLAAASLQTNGCGPNKTPWWHQNIQFLQAKSSYHRQLSKRFRAIEEAKNHLKSFPSSNTLHNKHCKPRYLWVSNSFRDQLKQAVNTYCEYLCKQEECYWHSHNYDILSPEEESLLQHVLIVAEETNDENVIGFVEVAMFVPKPSLEPEQEQNYQPTVMNLVVSALHRRRGIASRLLGSSIRYIRQNWILPNARQNVNNGLTSSSSQHIGLYVDKENIAALTLYQNHGFMKGRKTEEERLYLQRPIRQ